ncbi:MAG: hypothetical protein IK066_12690 [Kiritimatiellae bacterium]|nr:hypothetical protein [Kiritimatiellia bacterium]
MTGGVSLEGGFAEVGAGSWLVGHAQPAACFGEAVRRRRKGWVVRDRARLDLVETTGAAKCAEAARPFLTHIPCAAPISAVSDKVLVAPASARRGAEFIRPIPFSVKASICITLFAQPEPPNGPTGKRSTEQTSEPSNHLTIEPSNSPAAWVVMATASRTARVPVADGETLSVRPESAVAWTGRHPSGFCPKLGLMDLLLPRTPKNLLLRFHGPCIVWVEGAGKRAEPANPFARRAV